MGIVDRRASVVHTQGYAHGRLANFVLQAGQATKENPLPQDYVMFHDLLNFLLV